MDTGYYACHYKTNNVSKNIHNSHEIDQIYVFVQGTIHSWCRLSLVGTVYPLLIICKPIETEYHMEVAETHIK